MTGRLLALAIAIALAASSCLPLGGESAPEARPAPRQPKSIVDFISRPGGQILVVPDGEYTGGVVRAPHADRLVLVAESRGGVVVTSELTLAGPTSNVAFVGFAFRALVKLDTAKGIVFWYADATNPPVGFAGSRPTFLWVGSTTGGRSEDIRVLGADIHDIGDDGIQLGGSTNVRIEGTRIWDVDHRGVSPDRWHNDAIQWTGGATDHVLRFNEFGQKLQVGTEFGDIVNLIITDFWSRGSANVGVIHYVITDSARGTCTDCSITGTRERGNSWGHALGKDRVDQIDGHQRPPGSLPRIRVTDVAVEAGPPPVGIAGPVDSWRLAHPYSSWVTYLRGVEPA